MRLRAYTLHLAPGRDPYLLREGFCWPAFWLAPLWALRHRLWLGALAYVVLAAAIIALAPPWLRFPALLALHLLAGFEARDLLRARLARKGRPEHAVILAPDEDTALWRALREDPTALRQVKGDPA